MASRSLVSQVKHIKLFYNVYFYVGSFLVRLLKVFLKPNDRLIFFSSFSGKSYDNSPRALYESMLKDSRIDKYEFVASPWQKEKPEEIKQNIYKKTAIHRFATVDEIVDAYRFCIDNPFVNGSMIEVNGGYCYK